MFKLQKRKIKVAVDYFSPQIMTTEEPLRLFSYGTIRIYPFVRSRRFQFFF